MPSFSIVFYDESSHENTWPRRFFLYQSLTYHIAIGVRAILKQQIGGRYLVRLATRERQADVQRSRSWSNPVPRLRGLEHGRGSLNSELHTEAGKRYVRSRRSIVRHGSDFQTTNFDVFLLSFDDLRKINVIWIFGDSRNNKRGR